MLLSIKHLSERQFFEHEGTMTVTIKPTSLSTLILDGKTAAELMSPHVLSVTANLSLEEGISILVDEDLHAVPVVDEDGYPVGVLSRSDIVAHDRKKYQHLHEQQPEDVSPLGAAHAPSADVSGAPLRVRDIMTPVIYAVQPETPAKSVVQHMLVLGVHRLFVIGIDGSLLGVISSLDLLRHLHEPRIIPFDQVEMLCANNDEFTEGLNALRGVA
jgi:CBS-domain-containing membrane protein